MHTHSVNLTLGESLIKKTASPFFVTSKDYAKGWGVLCCFFDYETESAPRSLPISLEHESCSDKYNQYHSISTDKIL